MAIKRIIDTGFWEDEKVIDLFSVEDKYFMLYLLTNPKTTSIGIYSLPIKVISFDTGYTVEVVRVLLERFEKEYQTIVYDYHKQEIAVLNSLKYTISKGGKPIEDMIKRELMNVKETRLIKAVIDKLGEFWSISGRPIDKTISKLMIDEFNHREQTQTNLPIKNNANNNANAYANAYANTDSGAYRERIVNVSCDDSLKPHEKEHPAAKALAFYEQNIGIAKSFVTEEIIKWCDDLNSDVVIEAIKIAVSRQRPNYNYIKGILNSWVNNNIRTVKDVQAEQVQYQNKKQQSNGSRRHNTYQEPIPEAMKQKHEPQEEVTLESEEELKARLKELIGD